MSMFPPNTGPIRRSHHPGSSYDNRMQTTPQAIPQNPNAGIPQHNARNYGSTPRSFPGPGYSPAQSPHQPGQYMNQHVFSSGGGTPELNTSHVTVSSTGKSNGTYMFQPNQRMPFPPPQQTQVHSQNVYTPTTIPKFAAHSNSNASFMASMPQNPGIMTPGYYMPQPQPQVGRTPRFVPPNSVQTGTPMQVTSPHYFPTQPPTFYHQQGPMQPVPQYYDSTTTMSYQPSPQHQIPGPPQGMMQQAPVQPQPHSGGRVRKAITIRDPDSLKDVTDDILLSGKKSGGTSPSARSTTAPAIPSVPVQPSPETQIAADFAARVAKVATTNTSDRSAGATSQSEPPVQAIPSYPASIPPPAQAAALPQVSGIPSGVDTSVPPPPLETLSQPVAPKTSIPADAALSESPSQHMQVSPAYPNLVEGSGASPELSMPKKNPTPPVQVVTPTSIKPRQEAPVAVVQPVPHMAPAVDTNVLEKMHKMEEKFEVEMEQAETKPIINHAEPSKSSISAVVDEKSPDTSVSDASIVETSDVSTPSPVVEKCVDKPEQGPSLNNQSNKPSAPEPSKPSEVVGEKLTQPEPVLEDRSSVDGASTPAVVVTSPAALPELSVPAEVPPPKVDDVKSKQAEPVQDEKIPVKADDKLAPTDEDNKSDGDKRVPPESESKAVDETKAAPVAKDVQPAEAPESAPKNVSSENKAVKAKNKVKEEESAAISEQKETQELDPNEKKIYQRDFLMQFRYHSQSMEKPQGLPAIGDIMIDQSNSRGMRGMNQRQGGYSYSGSQGGPRQVKHVSIKREPEPELKKSENPWMPSKLDSKATESTEEAQTAEVLRQVRSILNKLTPQKFSPLMQKFQQLAINSEQRLRGVIDLIFEKAIDEPGFCEAYANMCRTMSQLRITTPATSGQSQQQTAIVEFRKVLLTRCQREFEKDRQNEEVLSKLRQKLEEATTPETKQQCKEKLDVAETKERRRMLGNIRFIGELFKLKMLTESIMHNCVMSLFKGRDDESLESLCRLLATIGKDLDHAKGKPRMDQYFQQIDKVIREKKTSSRVRFMLQDVVDLRKNNWVPRAVQAQGPKTIDQIHADAKEEKEQLALQAAVIASTAASNSGGKSQSRGSRRGGGGQSGESDGWTKVQQKVTYDPTKMKLSKPQNFDESTVTLGPTRGKGWKSGSGSTATKTGSGSYGRDRDRERERDRDIELTPRSSTPTIMNRFSALGASGGQDSYVQRGPGRASSREGSKSGSRGSSGSGGIRDSGRNERQAVLDTARRLTSQESKSTRRGSAPVSKSSTDSLSSTKTITDEAQIEKEYRGIIKEYFHLVDIKEAYECFSAMIVPSASIYHFPRIALEMSLEKSSTDRNNVAQLLCNFVKNKRIKTEDYMKGVVENMALAIDIELDLPKVWSCVAEQIAPIFYSSGNLIHLRQLSNLAEPLFEEDKAAVFVAEILKCLIKQLSVDTAVQYWNESDLHWEQILKTEDQSTIESFLKQHNLEAFFATGKQKDDLEARSKSIQDFETHQSAITKQLDMKKSNDDIYEWIQQTASAEERAHPPFVRALTTAVCDKAIIQSDKQLEVDKDFLKDRSLLLKKLIDTEEKELQAVYALQKLFLILEQPPNVLKLLFDSLYDDDVISEQTFFKWEKEEDPAESEGRGVALLSVNPFFTWLRSEEAESDE
ncbi:eukaryotic translation initiation factor 4 gamma 3-like isoform X2 [Clavelina lepadiformis]|uniref:eukaryotic translation initiation factor 4 gamma 3-like isoform X2 n=1 Tax=Clavelina lepadiformis TaxID=159417 RepID=UPI004041BA09